MSGHVSYIDIVAHIPVHRLGGATRRAGANALMI
jgi:hypothetical protein